jgi:hypothetical protein
MSIVAQVSRSDKSALETQHVQAYREELRETICADIRPVVETAFKDALDREVTSFLGRGQERPAVFHLWMLTDAGLCPQGLLPTHTTHALGSTGHQRATGRMPVWTLSRPAICDADALCPAVERRGRTDPGPGGL